MKLKVIGTLEICFRISRLARINENGGVLEASLMRNSDISISTMGYSSRANWSGTRLISLLLLLRGVFMKPSFTVHNDAIVSNFFVNTGGDCHGLL